jgi:superfamily II DNA or RNA helicase
MIDFNKLSRPKSNALPVDPLEIFGKTPNLKDAPNDLWKGQAEALEIWHKNRKSEDNAILLNTGAGKSIVGVLIAQSLVNEQIGPVVFVCSTIDLVEQTGRECERLGIPYTTRTHGTFSNDLFETGKAFCITTYQALFAAINAFSKEKQPAAVIFDDAHVAERMIRDAFTLSISKEDFPKLYTDIVNMVRPEFEKLGKAPHLSFVLD